MDAATVAAWVDPAAASCVGVLVSTSDSAGFVALAATVAFESGAVAIGKAAEGAAVAVAGSAVFAAVGVPFDGAGVEVSVAVIAGD